MVASSGDDPRVGYAIETTAYPGRKTTVGISATSTLTVATLAATVVSSPQLPTAPLVGVAALNLLPVGVFLQTRFERAR